MLNRRLRGSGSYDPLWQFQHSDAIRRILSALGAGRFCAEEPNHHSWVCQKLLDCFELFTEVNELISLLNELLPLLGDLFSLLLELLGLLRDDCVLVLNYERELVKNGVLTFGCNRNTIQFRDYCCLELAHVVLQLYLNV